MDHCDILIKVMYDLVALVMYDLVALRAARTAVMMWTNDQLGLARHSMASSHVKVLTTKPAEHHKRGTMTSSG